MKQITKKEGTKIESIISCLASRSGIKKDAYAIDYQATLNCLNGGRATKARHFVMLSAFCVKNPWLQFQQAKLKFEDALTSQSEMSYTIVRPTAFFKSVSGQLEVIQKGAPFVMFGDGEVTRCNPIAEADLATYLIDCIVDKKRENAIINLGGPDEPLTMKKQGEVSIGNGCVIFSMLCFLNTSIGSEHVVLTYPSHHRCYTRRLAKNPTFSTLPSGFLILLLIPYNGFRTHLKAKPSKMLPNWVGLENTMQWRTC